MDYHQISGSDDAENVSGQRRASPSADEAIAMGVKVLIVDDSLFMRTMIKNVILSTDSQVVGEAGSGEEAIQLYGRLRPNLVFLDIIMPGIGGIETLKEIKAMNNAATVVMCTSLGQDRIIAEAVAAGASDFITKPFNKDEIISVVRKIGG